MRRIKAGLLLACAMSLVTALAIPAFAGAANWKKGGTEYKVQQWQWSEGTLPLAEPASVGLEGTFGFENELGAGVSCAASATTELEPEYALGYVTSFNLSSCVPSGTLKASGCTFQSATANALPWTQYASAPGGTLQILTGESNITYRFEGAKCPSIFKEIVVTGEFGGVPDQKRPISSLTLTGEEMTSSPGKYATGVIGALDLNPSGKYGLMGKGVVSIEGPLQVSVPELGTLSCEQSGLLLIEPGSTGQVLSLANNNCSVSGPIFSNNGCQVTSVTSTGLPWTAVNEGTSIKIKNLDLALQYNKGPSCGWSTVKGELQATPNNVSAISSTTLSGSLTFGGFNAETSGSWSWSPAGVFGL